MVNCFVPDCLHKSDVDGCSMLRFPSESKSPTRKSLWVDLIRRADKQPNANSRVCSCHFEDRLINGKFLPTVFKRNIRKKFRPETITCKDCTKYADTVRENIILKEQLQEREKDNLSFEQQIESKLKEIEDKGKEISLINGKLEKATNENNVLQNKLQNEEAKYASLVKELGRKQEEVALFMRMLEEVNHKKLQELEKEKLEKKSLEKKVSEKEYKLKITNIDSIIHKSEIDRLEKEVVSLRNQKRSFHVEDIKDARLIAHFTGLPNMATFDMLLGLFEGKKINYYMKWNVECLTRSQQLLMTLMKLRRNLSNLDLALRFGVSTGTVSNVFLTWVYALHVVLFQNVMSEIPSRHKNLRSLPKSFSRYSSCRIILDCTEVTAANPKQMNFSNNMYSSYKHRITLKALVGIAPNGTMTFLSKLYGGSTSDKTIVSDSGVIEKLEPGDHVMADKGFTIGDLLPAGVTLNIPPFKTVPQFTPAQVRETFSIAQARIHVERAIQRLKLFHILDFIPGNHIGFASTIFQVCGSLTNLMKPLIKEVHQQMLDDDGMVNGDGTLDGEEAADVTAEDVTRKENSLIVIF